MFADLNPCTTQGPKDNLAHDGVLQQPTLVT